MIYNLKRSFKYFIIFMLAGLVIKANLMAAEVARGDGFVIDSNDVDAQKAFFSEMGLESSDGEHVRSTLKIRLFAIEAYSKGLVDALPGSTGPYRFETVREYYKIFQLYIRYLLESYVVSDDAINTYYLSYPEKFRLDQEASKEYRDGQDLWELDSSVRAWIKNEIAMAQKAVIIQKEYDRLMEKYHVVFK